MIYDHRGPPPRPFRGPCPEWTSRRRARRLGVVLVQFAAVTAAAGVLIVWVGAFF